MDAIQFALLPAAVGKFNVTTDDDAILLRTYVETVQSTI
jgi:hypothetical protein